MRRDLRILYGSAAALILVLGGYLQYELRAFAPVRPGEYWRTASGADFAVYYVAGWIARGEGNRSLYEGTPNDSIRNSDSPWLQVAHAHGVVATTPFQYPPFFALLMRPLTKLPLKSAFFVWRQLSAGFVLIAIYIALLMSRNKQRLPFFAMVAAAMLASFPFIEMKEMGQVGGLLLLLWTAGAYFADKDRPIAGAFCFAVGTMVKLTPAFVVPLFILRRQWKWLAAYTAWMTALFSISVWQLGWSNHVMFFTRFLPAMSCGFPSAANKSLMNIVQSLYYGNSFRDASHLAAMPPIVCAIGKALSAAVLIGVLIAFYRRTKDAAHIGYEVALLALVSLLVSPVTWRHHYVLALLPLLLMWTIPDSQERSKLRWPLLFAATVTIGAPFSHAMVNLVRSPALQLCFSMLMPAAAVVALLLGLTAYSTSERASAADHADGASSLSLNSRISALS